MLGGGDKREVRSMDRQKVKVAMEDLCEGHCEEREIIIFQLHLRSAAENAPK